MRTPLMAGNWKMYKTPAETQAFLAKFVPLVEKSTHVDVAICPTFVCVPAAVEAAKGSRVGIGAQNLDWRKEGAYTGEVSGPMIKAAGCAYVIIGHSERRQYFAETDEFVQKKVAAALKAGLRPIVCIGETLAEREANKTLEVVFRQLDAVTGDLRGRPGFGVIAYEPVWAIGTGKVATTEQAQEVHAAIRGRLKAISPELASETAILYGGSVKADNAAGLLACEDIDGALVGGASLDADGFAKIARAVPA